MDSDSFSCIRVITKNVPVTLSTAYQGNEITGISNVLDSWKRQYIQQLQGVVVSYKYVSLMSQYAYIKSDRPITHCDVKATFELFTPTVGSIVKGKVNRISRDYIGCLVHNSINVAIDRSCDECDSVSNFIVLDQVILFEITHIGFKRKIIRVKGKITQECINLMKNMDVLNVETSSTNQLTNFSHSSSEDTAGEDCGNNFDEDFANGNQSQSLLYDNVDLLEGNVKHVNASPEKKKKKKSNKFQTEQSIHKSFENLDMKNEDMSPSLLCNNSRLFDKESSDVSHDSSKKVKKKSDRSKKKLNNDMSFDRIEAKSEDETLSSLSYESAELCGKYSIQADSRTKKKKKKVSGSPSLFSDSSNKDEAEPFKIPRSPPKKKRKLSQEEFSTAKVTSIVEDFTSPFHDKDNILPTPLSTSISLSKTSLKTEESVNLLEVLSSYDPSLGGQLHNEVLLKNDKSLNWTKKGKKRKHESPEKDSLPKKKKKIEGKESMPEKTSSKQKPVKKKKKGKEKSEKDSKKGKKKKSKKRVISSKKKLPKLKKKKREKDGKLKKKLKKASKHKDDVP